MNTKYSKEITDKIKYMPSAIEEYNRDFANRLIESMVERGAYDLYLQGKITFDINQRFSSDRQAMEMVANFRPTDWRDK